MRKTSLGFSVRCCLRLCWKYQNDCARQRKLQALRVILPGGIPCCGHVERSRSFDGRTNFEDLLNLLASLVLKYGTFTDFLQMA